MTISLVVPQAILGEISDAAAFHLETAGVLLCSVSESRSGHRRLLARKMCWVPEEAYFRRDPDLMVIASEGYIHALGEAELIGATCLWVHTHPGQAAIPVASTHDKVVDCQLADLFRFRSSSPFYGALIFSPRESEIAFTGFLEREGEERRAVKRLWQVGDRWRLTQAFSRDIANPPRLFDRNIRAFGSSIQTTLGDLHVGIVGCGGTGSAVGEQLARLGIATLHLSTRTPCRRATQRVCMVLIQRISGILRPRCSRPICNASRPMS